MVSYEDGTRYDCEITKGRRMAREERKEMENAPAVLLKV
jgi:hypothetical protein